MDKDMMLFIASGGALLIILSYLSFKYWKAKKSKSGSAK